METAKTTFIGDSSSVDKLFAEIKGFSAPGLQAFRDFLDGFDSFNEAFRIKQVYSSASGANNLVVIFEPSDSLTEFVAALRAREVNRSFV